MDGSQDSCRTTEDTQFVLLRPLAPITRESSHKKIYFNYRLNLDQVIADMRSKGLVFRRKWSQLTYKTTMEDEVLLRPTIVNL